VTDRKRMEAQLEAERSRLFSVLDSMPAVVDVVDAETYDILFMNTYIREIYGHDGVGKKCYEVFHNFDAPCSFCNNETLLEKGEDESVQWEYFSETLKRHLITTNRLLKWPDGRRAKLEMSIDITDRKKAEHARKDLEAQLYQSQKLESVGRLAGGVAHDFNNMLGVILGKAEMALMELEPEDAHYADFREIQKVASRSADLTRQLLAFARRQTIAPRVLDLNETIEGMLKMMRRLIGEDIDLAWLPGSGLWPIKMDPSQIDQILANLCVNARDAIQDTGKITIETDTAAPDQAYCDQHTGFVPGEYVVLTISDDGFGMDKETIDHIFDPFFTTKAVGKGTGLGLATVYGIVKQNDGFIHVYSEPGKGSTFKIYFRRHVEQADPVEPKTSASPLAQGDETILLVEDDAEILHIALSMLERLGYRVLPVSSPGEAIREADMHPGDIHLLITDVVMPDMNGRDLSKRILSLYPNIKCLFMSGYTANVIAHHGVLDEGVHFIEKPFSINDLSAKVREALEGEAV
jgi:signal transduction histidine kinase/ActR/RegA family two-component response regulator